MKKLLLLAAVMGFSTVVNAVFMYDCAKTASTSYGYQGNKYDIMCRNVCGKTGRYLDSTGKCGMCVNDKTETAVDTGCTKTAPMCDAAQGRAGSKCLPATCKTTQYLNASTRACAACPANATCDGKTAKCKAGYVSALVDGAIRCVAKICAKNQHIEDGICKACPKNATCNGKDFSCKSYTYSKAHHACDVPHCNKNEYWNIANCEKCPANATCDGEKVIKCAAGYKLTGNKCVAVIPTCNKNQYLRFDKKQNREICEACPKGATCDGKNPKCPKGYTKDSEGRVICNSVNKCQQGSHVSVDYIRSHYKNCQACRVENIAAGKCAKNKAAHKHYYCDCDC
ncbi:MAG: hypothetical protein II942_03930 [Alphaproteobacteria bacterium]|nr:hypothetical protein [Alphaproteobacteria bacterium]